MNLFELYFTALTKTGIPYAITGRTENYPENIYSDIDIIIPTNKFQKFWDFMRKSQISGVDWIQVISHEYSAHYCIVTFSDGYKHQLIKPDVCSDYYRKGSLFIEAEYLLKNRIFNSKGFYQLAPDREFIYYLLKKVDKGNINQEQFSHLKKQWEQNSSACKIAMKPFFSERNKNLISQSIESNNIDGFCRNFDLLRSDIHQSLKFSLKDFGLKVVNRIIRILQPTGLVVAFMGPDGCGKTTIINGVKKDLSDTFRQYKQFHLFPKDTKVNGHNLDPHAMKERGLLGSIIKLFYFLALYVIGYWNNVFPLKVRSTFVIFDRYYHDLIVDPKRYRYGAGRILIYIIGFFIPKPDLWILLDAPADVIQRRKSEVTP